MEILCFAVRAYVIVLIVRIILSWVEAFGGRVPEALRPAAAAVYALTEPLMGFFRRYIPPIGGLDISPIFIFIGLQILAGAICSA